MAFRSQRNLRSTPVLILLFALLYPSWSGCVGLPQGRSMFRKPPPEYKAQYKSPTARVAELQQLARQADQMTVGEQQNACVHLQQSYGATSDPILRGEIVKTLGAMPHEAAHEGLHQAAEAEDPRVRMAAVAGWSLRSGPEAEAVLGSLLVNDPDVDVRLAAARALSRFSTASAGKYLAQVLKDRNPAVQLAAMQSLKTVTGLDLGNDVNEWIAHASTPSPSENGAPSLPSGVPQVADPSATHRLQR